MHDVSQVRFTWASPTHLYLLEEYAELQAATREQKAKPGLEEAIDRIQQVQAGWSAVVTGCSQLMNIDHCRSGTVSGAAGYEHVHILL